MTLSNKGFADFVLSVSGMDKEEIRHIAHSQYLESQESHRGIATLKRKLRKLEMGGRDDHVEAPE